MLTRSHLEELDYLRVFGLITIVFIHSLNYFSSIAADNSFSHTIEGLTVNLLRYGRFIFVFVTGLVLFLTSVFFYERRLKNLVIP